MQLLFPFNKHNMLYLEEAGYTAYGYPSLRDTHIFVEPKTKRFGYSYSNSITKLTNCYIPKVLTNTSLLDQIPLLEALGLSEKEIIEILRS